jgi:predicted phosphodiesterase
LPRAAPRPTTTGADAVIAILSDLHLGLKAAPSPAAIAPLLEGVDELILNGDAAECASARYAAAGKDALEDLARRARSAGAALVRIEGNHDPGTGELLVRRAEGAVLVTHGHAFHPAIAPWSPVAADRRGMGARERQDEHARPPVAVLRGMLGRPWSLPMVIGYWRIFPELSARFAELASAPGAPVRAVVSGHSHRAGAWFVRRTLVLNTGSFTFPGQPHMATVDAGEVALVPLVRQRGEWRQDPAGRRAWRIDEIARSTAARSTPVS